MTVSLDEIIAHARKAETVRTGTRQTAADDQDRAAIRELAEQLGLDLTNRGTAATVLRTLTLVRETGKYLAGQQPSGAYLRRLIQLGPGPTEIAALTMAADAQVTHTALHTLTNGGQT